MSWRRTRGRCRTEDSASGMCLAVSLARSFYKNIFDHFDNIAKYICGYMAHKLYSHINLAFKCNLETSLKKKIHEENFWVQSFLRKHSVFCRFPCTSAKKDRRDRGCMPKWEYPKSCQIFWVILSFFWTKFNFPAKRSTRSIWLSGTNFSVLCDRSEFWKQGGRSCAGARGAHAEKFGLGRKF